VTSKRREAHRQALRDAAVRAREGIAVAEREQLTMTLRNTTAFNGLPICQKCGWPMAGQHEIAQHKSDCHYVAAGANAEALAARFPELASTKCGSGTGQLTFKTDRELHVRFQCRDSKTKPFRLEEVWLLDNLTADEAAGLVEAIADWRSNCIRARAK
jgi:hypothetical protein